MTTIEKPITKESEIRRIKRLIRKGILPRYCFVRTKDGKLERDSTKFTIRKGRAKMGKGRLTWRREDVLVKLTKDLPDTTIGVKND